MIDPSQPLPSSHEMEQAVLSVLLNNLDFALPLVVQAGLTEEWFHQRAHGVLFREIFLMEQTGVPVDLMTVCQLLTDKLEDGRPLLDKVGGAGELAAIFSLSAAPQHLPEYLKTLKDKHWRRTILEAAGKLITGIMDTSRPVEEVLGEVEGVLFELQVQKGGGDLVPMKALVMESLEHIQMISKNRGHVTDGLATGFTDLDRTFQGLKPGNHVVIGARPAMGKTALVQCIVESAGLGSGHYKEFRQPPVPTVFISLEMSGGELVQRMLMGRAGLDLIRLRDGMFKKSDFARLQQSSGEFMKAPIYFWDAHDLTIQEIRSKMRSAKKRLGIGLICLDYLQLCKSNTRQAKMSREREVAEVSAGLKHMAKELAVPVITLAQLNRETEGRGAGKPKLADLRESGSIEQDADIVGLLYRPSYYKPEAPSDFEGTQETWESRAVLTIAKHRNGPVGDIALKWTGNLTRFESETDRLFSNNEEQRQH